jgi:hypothetical protein
MRKDKRSPQRIKTSTPSSPGTSPLGASLFSGIFQGFSFGAGSSIAHNIFRMPYTGAGIHPSNETLSVCETLTKDYIKTCKENIESISQDPKKCETMLKDLKLVCQPDSKIIE